MLFPRNGIIGNYSCSFNYSPQFPKFLAVSTGRRNTCLKFTRRRFKVQGFPRALIETQGYFIEVGLRVAR